MECMGKRIFFFLVIALMFFSSCEKKTKEESLGEETAGESSDRIIAGFSQIGAESAWRIYNTKDMQEAALKAGIRLLYVNAEQKQENQIKAIRTFIMYQVDVIAFVPIVQDGWENVLREAKDAGIPVIVCDRKLTPEYDGLYAGYIGTDSDEEGRKAAFFLLEKFKDVEKTLNILEIRGTDGASASDGRIRGFREVIGTDSKFCIISSESGDFMRSRGEEIARKILSEGNGTFTVGGKNIDIVFSCNDGMTLGMLDVLEQNGVKTGKGSPVTVVSFDAQQEAIDRLKDGRINCVVECNPEQGDVVMDLVKKLANGQEIPKSTVVADGIFTEYDDLSLIPERKY